MNEPIENDIARLAGQLRRPSADLDRRIEAAFAEHATDRGVAPPVPIPFRLPRVLLTAAACLFVGVAAYVLTRTMETPTIDPSVLPPPLARVTPDSAPRIQPVRFDTTVTEVDAGDIVVLDNRLPVVPIHRTAVQTARWVDGESGARIELTVPRHDMLIVPIPVD